MNEPFAKPVPSWSEAILGGATTGFAISLIYASCFATYATLRSSFAVSTMIPGDALVPGTLLSNLATIALASFSATVALAPLTATLGTVTACGIYAWYRVAQSPPVDRDSLWLGAALALAAVVIFQLTIYQLVGPTFMRLGWATYLFWLGLPALLHIAAGSAGAWYLGHRWQLRPTPHP